MELNHLLNEMFICKKNLVTLTSIFFNKKFISRNNFVQLNRNKENKQKSFMQKAFFFRGSGGKNNNNNKKLPWTVVLYQGSHRERDCRNLIQLELNWTIARRCCLLCPFYFMRRIDYHSSLKNSGGLNFVLENLSMGCLTIYNIEEW